jgi:hypothetical protein
MGSASSHQAMIVPLVSGTEIRIKNFEDSKVIQGGFWLALYPQTESASSQQAMIASLGSGTETRGKNFDDSKVISAN